jgi:hypothetical protein
MKINCHVVDILYYWKSATSVTSSNQFLLIAFGATKLLLQ